MGLIDRLRRKNSDESSAPEEPRVRTLPDPGKEPLDALPLTPQARKIEGSESERIATGVAALEAEGVDLDDLRSISDGLDRALAHWLEHQDGDHDLIVERYAIGVGEHLHRHTDLAWEVVTDVFGTDLAVCAGDFVVVPVNLVAVRWMRREQGWVPRVIGHLVQVRQR